MNIQEIINNQADILKDLSRKLSFSGESIQSIPPDCHIELVSGATHRRYLAVLAIWKILSNGNLDILLHPSEKEAFETTVREIFSEELLSADPYEPFSIIFSYSGNWITVLNQAIDFINRTMKEVMRICMGTIVREKQIDDEDDTFLEKELKPINLASKWNL